MVVCAQQPIRLWQLRLIRQWVCQPKGTVPTGFCLVPASPSWTCCPLQVHLCHWRNLPAGDGPAPAVVIEEGTPIAIKLMQMADGRGGFHELKTIGDLRRARKQTGLSGAAPLPRCVRPCAQHASQAAVLPLLAHESIPGPPSWPPACLQVRTMRSSCAWRPTCSASCATPTTAAAAAWSSRWPLCAGRGCGWRIQRTATASGGRCDGTSHAAYACSFGNCVIACRVPPPLPAFLPPVGQCAPMISCPLLPCSRPTPT